MQEVAIITQTVMNKILWPIQRERKTMEPNSKICYHFTYISEKISFFLYNSRYRME